MNKKQRKRREKQERAIRKQAITEQPRSVTVSSPQSRSTGATSFLFVFKNLWTGIGLFWKAATGVGVLLSLVAIYAFQPLVSVEEKDYSLDSSDPMRTPFIVKNDGFFPVYRMVLGCHEGRTLSTDPRRRFFLEDNSYENIRTVDELESGGRTEMYCESGASLLGGGVYASNIEIKVGFRAVWFRPDQFWVFKFVARRDAHGEQHWEPIGLQKVSRFR